MNHLLQLAVSFGKISLFFVSTLSIGGVSASTASPPNVVVMLSDDQGWGDFSIHGNPHISTPNLDKLAESGVQFDHFFVCALCAPTRAEFLTGRYFKRTGVRGVTRGKERLNTDEMFISDIFKRAGYKTAAFGKWHNGMQYPYHPNARGFDEFYGFCSGHWAHYYSPMLDHNGEIVTGSGYLTDDLTERAMSYIENHKQEAFFVYLAFNTPHSPMQVPDKWWNKFEKMQDDLGAHTCAAYAMVENIDWNVGRLVKKIEELKLRDNTIILYFNDNGPNGKRWNGGMKGKKGSLDEGGVRSPLFLSWPSKIQPGTKIPHIAGAIDLLPTLSELVDIDYSGTKPLDGKSLKPLLVDSSEKWPERILYQSQSSFKPGTVSLRTQRYRMDSKGKLYDMIEDLGQESPINKQKPEVVKMLEDKAKAWSQEMLEKYGNVTEERSYIIGHPGARMTQVPARDAKSLGGIERSSKFPNASYFTNWTSTKDTIEWRCEVGQSGIYKAEIFYTCKAEDLGSTVRLSFMDNELTGKITEAHDSPLIGMKEDRVKRKESYDKEWGRMTLGEIRLEEGNGRLRLQATDIPGAQVMDFRMLLLTRMNDS
ncbi:MAG: arylsulfatase [Verrucomicrobiota bacterium]